MSYIPKYILKRMVPKNSFFTVDKNGDGKGDAIGFYIINVLSPLTIPSEIPSDPKELAKLAGVDDLNKLITVTLNGVDIGFDFKKLELRHEDKSARLDNLAAAAGITIPVRTFACSIHTGSPKMGTTSTSRSSSLTRATLSSSRILPSTGSA